jgi:hypothetical protein
LYKAPETEEGGDNAIDFDQSIVVSEGEDFFSIPVSQLTPGTYEYRESFFSLSELRHCLFSSGI